MSERILLVEDDEFVRKPVVQVLEELGYDVVAVSGPLEALKLGEEIVIDLLVTDVAMSEMSGPRLADALAPARPGMRVLYVSGYADDGSLGEAFLQKPFGAEELAAKVDALLDG